MKHKGKIVGGGIVGIIIALAAIGISKFFDGGGLGLGSSGQGNSSATTKRGDPSGAALVITLDGEQYLVDGSPRSFNDVVSAAEEISKSQSEQSGTQILLKKKGTARYMSVQKLEDEFKKHGIRYRTENDF